MLEIKVNGEDVKVEMKGKIGDLTCEYARLTSSVMRSLLMPFSKEAEYEYIAGKMTVAFFAGVELAIGKRKEEVSRGSAE